MSSWKKHLYPALLLTAGAALSTPAETRTYSAADLVWSDSGSAVSSLTNGVLEITAAKNSQVTAALPSRAALSETGNTVSVSFDITVSGGPFPDDSSTFRVGLNNSDLSYAYYAAFEPAGGTSQAIFGESGDSNLGRFDVLSLEAVPRTLRFTLKKTDLAAGLDLTAAGTLVDTAGNTITVEPDIVPASVTTFNEVYFYCSGNLWTNRQKITLSNLTVKTVLPDPAPQTVTFTGWALSHSLPGGNAAADSDPDGDGINNLIEFATGSDPNHVSPHPVAGRIDGDGSFLITYSRHRGGSGADYKTGDLTYSLEFRSSLATGLWQSATGLVSTVGSPIAETNGFTERVTLRLGSPEPSGFVRLKIQYAGSVPVVTEPVPLELLENGGFENGDTGWSQDGQHILVSSPVHNGSAALQYTATDSYAGAQVFYVTGGRKYRFSGWIKTGTNYTGTAGVSLNFRDMNGVNLGSVTAGGTRFAAGTDWTQMVEIVTVPTNAAKMKVLLITGGTGDVWYDDLSVTPFEPPEDPAITAPAAPPIAGTWIATFEDNFDGTELDGSKWQLGGLNGFAVTASDRCAVSNGVLTISAAKIPATLKGVSNDWSSASISTYKNFRQLYGYFEARMRYETKVGLWPAFWTMPDRAWYGDTNENYKVWMQFDLAGRTVPFNKVELKLRTSAALSKATVLNVFPAPDNWSENTITWKNMPMENPLWLKHDWIPVAPAGQELRYDLTGYVNQQLAGDKKVSFCLADTFQQGQTLSLYSREATDPASRPQLILDGVPLEPAADAAVRSGSYAGINYAADTQLKIKDAWQANNRSTEDGGMEIDVFEWLGVWDPYRLHSALHWDGYYAAHQSTNFPFYIVGNTVAEYHTYGVYWEPGRIEFYFDGKSTGGVFATNRICSIPSYLILCLQMGGWSGNDNLKNINANEYPGKMEVDYVKAWSETRQ